MADRILLESGDLLLLESGDAFLLESAADPIVPAVTYRLPDDFNDALDIRITDNNNVWTVTGCSVADLVFIPSITYYVNYSTGNDSNDGQSSGAAVKTFDQAAVLAQAYGGAALIILEDEIIGQNSLTTTAKTFSRDIKIRSGSASGRTLITNIDEDLTPSWTDNTDGTYSATTGMEDFPACFDHGTLDADGIGTPLQSVASGATCVSTAGSFYWDGVSTLMVHMPDDREPDSNFIYCPAAELGRMNVKTSNSSGLVILENLTAYHNGGAAGGGGGLAASCTVSSGPGYNTARLGMKDCYSAGSNGNGFGILDFSVIVMENCVARYCREDGFNYHAAESVSAGRYMALYEINCKATDCGYDGVFQDQPARGSSENATSCHDSMRSFRLGGYYERSYGPVVADVNGTYNYLVDCYASDPGLTGASGTNAAYYHDETVDPGSDPVGSYLVYCDGNAVTSGSGAVMLSEQGTWGHISYYDWQGTTPVTVAGTPTLQADIASMGLVEAALASSSTFFITTTRRTFNGPPKRRVYPKPTRGLFR